MRARPALLPLLALPLAAALGCHFVLPKEPVPGTNQGPWAAERDRFTRTTRIYDKCDDKAFATATYQAPPVRAARVARLAVWRGLTDQERDARLAAERDDAARFEDFLLAFYTADRRANDLDATPSTWRVVLLAPDGAQLAPLKIEEVRIDPTLQQLYPYIGNFDVVYHLRFPRWNGPQPLEQVPFTLQLAGALGKVEVRFDGKARAE